MVCEQCKECWNYMVSEIGCYGSTQICEHFQTDTQEEDEYLENGVIVTDKKRLNRIILKKANCEYYMDESIEEEYKL